MADKKKILVVDDAPSNLLAAKGVLSEKYEVYTANSAENMFKNVAKIAPDLILLDIEMPEVDGFAAIEKLKADADTKKIPVIFLTGRLDIPSEVKALKLGAVDFITKPFVPDYLLRQVEKWISIERPPDAA